MAAGLDLCYWPEGSHSSRGSRVESGRLAGLMRPGLLGLRHVCDKGRCLQGHDRGGIGAGGTGNPAEGDE